MRGVCASCGKEIGERDRLSRERGISRGICSVCVLGLTGGKPRTAGKILSLIEEPVFLIDSDGAVRGANRAAAKMLHKELPDIEGQMGGDAFECSYAKEEGGCGRTVHCKACAIRNIVMDTLSTGHGYDKVPAYQCIDTPGGPETIRFVITTERVGDQILLRIDSSRKAFSY